MKKCIRTTLGILVLLFCFHHVHAQVTITGKITDESQEGVTGASVRVKGTTLGTISDINGNYSIEVPEADMTLIFSFIGYKTQEVAVGNETIIDIKSVYIRFL